MGSQGENLAVVRSFYDALFDGDLDAILDAVDDAIELEVHAPGSIPFAGRYLGCSGLIEFFEVVGDHVERDSDSELAPDAIDFIDGGDRIVVLGSGRFRGVETGIPYECWWVHVLSLRDGRIVRIDQYFDTVAVLSGLNAASNGGDPSSETPE